MLGIISLGLTIGTTLVLVTNPRKWRNIAIFWYCVAGILALIEVLN
jgi:hypothetical protein